MTTQHDEQVPGFEVRLTNFEGPFDLLLQLISKQKLDITEVALAKVSSEFIAYVGSAEVDLSQTSSFLVVAATLLDLKAARLLPSGEVDDDEDIAALEARDLLFARLLQYRAFKELAAQLERTLEDQSRSWARPGGLEAEFRSVLPDLVLTLTPRELAQLAVTASAPRPAPTVSVEHLHGARVSVSEQANLLAARLRRDTTATFRALIADADRITIVARFLALLELFREGLVLFEQLEPMGELTVTWSGSECAQVSISSEYDEQPPELGGTDV